jgi:hypothetical protein
MGSGAMRISAFLALFMVLLLLWAGGFLVYHVTSFMIHFCRDLLGDSHISRRFREMK